MNHRFHVPWRCRLLGHRTPYMGMRCQRCGALSIFRRWYPAPAGTDPRVLPLTVIRR